MKVEEKKTGAVIIKIIKGAWSKAVLLVLLFKRTLTHFPLLDKTVPQLTVKL